jgi:5'/3'-nucleotidase
VNERALILLSNDDGIEAEGLSVLARELRTVADVLVVAPDGERSATSHAINISANWKYRRLGEGEYSLDGTPADCVYVAMTQLAPRPPALVVSGINNGYNLGTDVLYSGTVAAAAEGVVLGVPGIALSMEYGAPPETGQRAARFGAALASWVLDSGWHPPWTLLNVNVPIRCSGDRFGVGAMGTRRYRPAPRQQETWPEQGTLSLTRPAASATHGAQGEDAQILNEEMIAVSPLKLDWTARDQLNLGEHMSLTGFESNGRLSDNDH